MEAHERTLLELFRFDIRYEMPETQREYVWDLKDRWEPLWNDIRATAEAHLVKRDAPHFLGPLAVQEVGTEGQLAGNVVTKSVIDGQQRLTTLQLVVNAARVVTAKYHQQTADALYPLVFNNIASWPNGNQDYQYKIWSKASDSNRRAFIQAMAMDERNTTQSELGTNDESAIINAHRFFVRRIGAWISERAEGRRKEYCEALRHALLGLLTVIIIDIGEDDNPRLIYETLNGRGTSLLQSDLIKNRIMGPEVAEVASWPFDDAWWSAIPDDEQQRRNRADVLLGHWITMRGMKFTHPMGIFDSYRVYEEGVRDTTRRVILQDIQEMAGIYSSYIHEDQDARRLIGLASTDIVPLIMWLRASTRSLGDEGRQWRKGWLALSSFVSRKRMTGQDTTGDGFREIIETILRGVHANRRDVTDPADRIVASLKGLVNKKTTEWPDDHMLLRSFLNRDIYNDPGREVTRDILLMLERGIPFIQRHHAQSMPASYLLRTGDDGGETPDSVSSIEHIMPRAWRGEHWRTSLDEKFEDASRRDEVLHTIGNLTLVTPELNSRLGNNGWRNKRELLSGDAESKKLLMNQQLIQQSPERWDVEEIDNRATYLYHVARNIWPGPNSQIWQ